MHACEGKVSFHLEPNFLLQSISYVARSKFCLYHQTKQKQVLLCRRKKYRNRPHTDGEEVMAKKMSKHIQMLRVVYICVASIHRL